MYRDTGEPQGLAQAAAPSDRELVERSARGEAAAFELIMRRHNRLLFRSARGVLNDDAEAQDVVQEAYLRAFATLGSFRGDSALGTWLARIAINLALDARRKRNRTVLLDDTQASDTHADAEHTMSHHAHGHESPERQAERGEMRALLERAIDTLPAIYRSVFMLRAVEEMSVGETASCLQVSEDVVKTRYLRARSMLRDALGAQAEAHVQEAYAFAGARCDAVVAQVMAELLRQGRIHPGPPG